MCKGSNCFPEKLNHDCPSNKPKIFYQELNRNDKTKDPGRYHVSGADSFRGPFWMRSNYKSKLQSKPEQQFVRSQQ